MGEGTVGEGTVADVHRGPHLGQLVVGALGRLRDVPVLQSGDVTLTGGEMAAHVSQYAAALASFGVDRGSAVGLLSLNRPEALMVLAAGHARGHRRTPLHPLDSLEGHAHALADAEVTTLVVDPALEERAAALARAVPSLRQVLTLGAASVGTDLVAAAARCPAGPVEVDDLPDDHVVSVTYTRGTTGTPKGVVSTARSLAALTLAQVAEWEWPERPRFLMCAPLSLPGADLLAPVLMKGGTLVLLPAFEAGAVLEAIERERITATMLVPSMVHALLDHPDVASRDLSSLEVLHYGGSSTDSSRIAEAIELMGPVLSQHYGQSECPLVVSQLSRADHRGARLASCGRPSAFLRAALLDEDGRPVAPGEPGEICVAGPPVADGYWGLPDQTAAAFAADGWLRTGDVARQDADGFWYVVDRADDRVVTDGSSVFPREVEDVIATHPAVAQVAVIGVPDERLGEAVVAVVVPRSPSFSYDDADEIVALVRERMGPARTPRRVLAVPSLPLTALGETDKEALRAQFAGLGAVTGADDLSRIERSAGAAASRHRAARSTRPPAAE